jgi:hypothetical protein
MKRGFLVVAILVAASSAHADVGVVVTGEATLQPALASQLEVWLKLRGHTVQVGALEPDAINTLIDCFVVEDLNCARTLVERRSSVTTVIYARAEMTANETDGSRDISLIAYWLSKGHETMGERRVCHHCTEEQLRSTADDLMGALASQPPIGSHVPAPAKVAAAHTADMEPPPAAEERPPSRLVPAIVLGAGAALAITGAVLIAIDQDATTTGLQQPTYRDTATAGVVFTALGAATVGLGAYLWFTQTPTSTPVAAVTRDGAVVGWSGRF